VTLSDLANYPMTRSNVRSVCDSWTSCWYHHLFWCRQPDVAIGIPPIIWSHSDSHNKY